MKSKKQYLLDLELDVSEKYSDSELKSQWRRLTKKYHPDNGSEKNEEKFKLVSEACESLISGNYESENFEGFKQKIKFSNINPHDLLNKLNDNFMGVIRKGSINVDLNEKKSKSKIVVMGNQIVNIDYSTLTEEKFLKFPNGLMFRFSK